MTFLVQIVLTLAVFGGVPMLALFVTGRFLQRRRKRFVSPVRERMSRPPGESLRLQLEKMDERSIELFTQLLIVPILIGFLALSVPEFQVIIYPIFGLAAAISVAMALRGFIQFSTEFANLNLGYRGERFVGGLLETLRGFGYQVFHDIPFDGFNIDHVVVGPGGVFAVETKTRRKATPNTTEKGKPQKVRFDGRSLHFPGWSDQWGVQQARDNARHLSIRLSAATGGKVQVDPILVLPGWWVESQTNKPVLVVNPKQLVGFVRNRPAILQPAEIQRIAYQLERMAEIEF